MFFFSSFKPAVPKKPKRSVPVSSSVDRDQSRVSAAAPLSREASDIVPTPAVRKTDVRTETQPNGSELTTTIVEFTDQVSLITVQFYSRTLNNKSLWSVLFQDHSTTGLSELSYSTRQSVSPVSTNTSTPPIVIQPAVSLYARLTNALILLTKPTEINASMHTFTVQITFIVTLCRLMSGCWRCWERCFLREPILTYFKILLKIKIPVLEAFFSYPSFV